MTYYYDDLSTSEMTGLLCCVEGGGGFRRLRQYVSSSTSTGNSNKACMMTTYCVKECRHNTLRLQGINFDTVENRSRELPVVIVNAVRKKDTKELLRQPVVGNSRDSHQDQLQKAPQA